MKFCFFLGARPIVVLRLAREYVLVLWLDICRICATAESLKNLVLYVKRVHFDQSQTYYRADPMQANLKKRARGLVFHTHRNTIKDSD